MRKGFGLRMAVVFVVLGLLIGCSSNQTGQTPATDSGTKGSQGSQGSQAQAPKARQVAVKSISTNPAGLDPATASGVDSEVFDDTIYETLVYWAPQEAKIQPQLAERWEASADGKTYTFYLRQGVKFHDGTPFNAEAVKFNVERQINPNHPYAPKEAPMGQFMFGSMESISVVDDNTVRFNLKYPYGPLLANLTINNAGMASPTAIQKYGAEYGKHPVGTGPFKFESWDKDVAITLLRNDKWWDAEGPSKQNYPWLKPGNDRRPYLDGLIFKVIPNLAVQTEELLKGTVHVPYDVSTDDAQRLKDSPNIQFQAIPFFSTGYLGFNVTKPIVSDVRVRQAIAMVIDKNAIANKVFSGWMTPAKSLTMPGMLGYPKDLQDYRFDVAAGKALLAEAGYPNGFEIELLTHSNPRFTNPKGPKLAEAIQPMLAAIGIKAKITVLEWPAYLDAMKAGTASMFTLGWGSDNLDPDNTLYYLTSSKMIPDGNRTRWNNPEANQLLDQAQQESNPDKRAAMYQRVEQLLHDEVPLIPLNHNNYLYVRHKSLKGSSPFIFGDQPGYWWIESGS